MDDAVFPHCCTLWFFTQNHHHGVQPVFASTGVLRLPVLGCTEERVVGIERKRTLPCLQGRIDRRVGLC